MGSIFHLIQHALRQEPVLHPVEQQLAKRWVKQRLSVVFPELRNDPKALEQAYRDLSLEPREGDQEGEAETVFEVKLGDREPGQY